MAIIDAHNAIQRSLMIASPPPKDSDNTARMAMAALAATNDPDDLGNDEKSLDGSTKPRHKAAIKAQSDCVTSNMTAHVVGVSYSRRRLLRKKYAINHPK